MKRDAASQEPRAGAGAPRPVTAAEREHLQADLDGVGSKPPRPTLEVPCGVTPEAAEEVARRFLRDEGAPPTVALSELRATVVPVLFFEAAYRVAYRGQRARRVPLRRAVGRDSRGDDVYTHEFSLVWESASGARGFGRRHARLASSRPLPLVALSVLERLPGEAWQPLAAGGAPRADDSPWVSRLDAVKAELADAALAEARSQAREAIGGEAQRLDELTCEFTLRSVVAGQATVYLASFEIAEARHAIAVDGATGGVACSWTDTPRAQSQARRDNLLAGVATCLAISACLLYEFTPHGRAELAAFALGPLGVYAAGLFILRLTR